MKGGCAALVTKKLLSLDSIVGDSQALSLSSNPLQRSLHHTTNPDERGHYQPPPSTSSLHLNFHPLSSWKPLILSKIWIFMWSTFWGKSIAYLWVLIINLTWMFNHHKRLMKNGIHKSRIWVSSSSFFLFFFFFLSLFLFWNCFISLEIHYGHTDTCHLFIGWSGHISKWMFES